MLFPLPSKASVIPAGKAAGLDSCLLVLICVQDYNLNANNLAPHYLSSRRHSTVVTLPVKIKGGRFICIRTHALLRVDSKEQFITAFKLNRGVAECLGYRGMPPFLLQRDAFLQRQCDRTSLTAAFQLVPSDTR